MSPLTESEAKVKHQMKRYLSILKLHLSNMFV